MSALEVAANIFMVAAVYLAARNHWSTWPIGVVGCILFAAVFFQAKLYADVTLQVFFVVTNLVGWRLWQHAGEGEERPISRISLKTAGLVVLPATVIAALAYGTLLAATTDAHLPIPDSFVLTFSIAAQFLLMARKIETWFFWFVVDAIAIPLFATKGLYLTSFVYAIFLANAVYGYFNWKAEMKAQHA